MHRTRLPSLLSPKTLLPGVTMLAALAGAALRAQDDAVEPAVDVATLARRLRQPALEEAARAEIVEALLAAGENGAQQLFNTVRVDLQKRFKDWLKARDRHLRDFARSAPLVLRHRGGREGPARIDALRDEILGFSRSGDLSKETVHSEIDPRFQELEGLCQVSVAQVLEVDEDLAEDAAELDAGLVAMLQRFADQERAEEVLLRTTRGAQFLDRYELAPDPRELPDELRRARERLAFQALPMSSRDRKVMEGNEASIGVLEKGEYAGIRELNRIRLILGLGALQIDEKLCTASRDHSRDMVEHGFFAHQSPIPGKETPGKRAALAGTSAGAENIAAGQSTGLGAIRAWWYSPGHHRNMLGGHGRIGLGRHQNHWTQMFGG